MKTENFQKDVERAVGMIPTTTVFYGCARFGDSTEMYKTDWNTSTISDLRPEANTTNRPRPPPKRL